MRRAVNRHRVGPGNRTLRIPEQKRQVLFQFVQDNVDTVHGQIQLFGK